MSITIQFLWLISRKSGSETRRKPAVFQSWQRRCLRTPKISAVLPGLFTSRLPTDATFHNLSLTLAPSPLSLQDLPLDSFCSSSTLRDCEGEGRSADESDNQSRERGERPWRRRGGLSREELARDESLRNFFVFLGMRGPLGTCYPARSLVNAADHCPDRPSARPPARMCLISHCLARMCLTPSACFGFPTLHATHLC